MTTKLYGFSISNPTITARLMLERKGIDFEFVDVMPGSQRWAMRAFGFSEGTVPGLKIDGDKIIGSTNISKALEEFRPEPPLFPADPSKRTAVEAAEAWADDVLQNAVRRPYRWGMARDRRLREDFSRTMGMPLPAVGAILAGPLTSYYARRVCADESTVRAGIAELPGVLDRIDDLIVDGTIGGEEPNAADFQIAPSVRLLMSFADFAPAIEGRPAAEHAVRLVPELPGCVPPFIPPAWLEPLKAAAPAAE